MKTNEKETFSDPGEIDEKREASAVFSRRRKRKTAPGGEVEKRPAFAAAKKLFKKRNFRRQYALFRKGGLGVFDSFFNSLYIHLTEKSVEKEKARLQKSGEGEDPRRLLDFHAPILRALSFLPRRAGKIASLFLSWGKRDRGTRVHSSKIAFLRAHLLEGCVVFLALFTGLFVTLQLSRPVVLRAQIDGKVIGIVESKNLVDSAVNELEDNVEIILGKSFHFPYEIQYRFSRQWGGALTDKSKISETLYTYVSDYICTACGLYVDDVLVAVCADERTMNQGLEDFIQENAEEGEAGIFNDIMLVTQAYPTESILNYDEFRLILKEMSTPLEERKRSPVPGEAVLTEAREGEEEDRVLPAMVLVADSTYAPREKEVSRSNYPKSIDNVKLDLYTSEVLRYQSAIPYETLYVESSEHYTTMADVTTRGAAGLAQVEAKVYYVNGKEAKREILQEKIEKTPTNQVISIGNKVLPEKLGLSGAGSFIVPRVGVVSSYFEVREDGAHRGWDIPGDEGDNIYASASGKVIVAIGPDGAMIAGEKTANLYTGYGYCIVIEHTDGFRTLYGHCSKIDVTLGQEVRQGEKIGEIGNTGASEGNHVHFEIILKGVKVDPALYLYQGTKTIYD